MGVGGVSAHDAELVMRKGLRARTNFNINDVLASLEPEHARNLIDLHNSQLDPFHAPIPIRCHPNPGVRFHPSHM